MLVPTTAQAGGETVGERYSVALHTVEARRWLLLCSTPAQSLTLTSSWLEAKRESALHVAAAQGADAVAAALIMLAGADINLRYVEKRSTLDVAAKAGHHVVVRELLLKGALP